jgi:hypothetical protein
VRRTKSDLNRLVEKRPSLYRDVTGKKCRYPRHNPVFYDTGETSGDRRIATQIRELSSQLRGLLNLQTAIQLPEFLRQFGVTEAQVVERRLKSAPALARWQVMSMLRSSSAALWEHVFGTQDALEKFRIEETIKVGETGAVIAKLEMLAGHPPDVLLEAPLPEWLSNERAHAAACEKEAEIYREMGELCGQISTRRLEARSHLLFKLWRQGRKVIGFDRALISLYLVKRRLKEHAVSDDALVVATGDPASKKRLVSLFERGAEGGPAIALCSDAVSEAVNLQEASDLLHLDLPTVIRTVEQRVGRIDRMDSPHESIEVHWPRNTEEFSLRTDDRLHERLRLVEELLGSNVPLPSDTADSEPDEVISTDDLVESLGQEEHQSHWDGLQDAFGAVRGLVEGSQSLVPESVYRAVVSSRAKIISAISVVQSKTDWVFFAIAGLEGGASRWVLADGENVSADLQRIPEELRSRLSDASERELDRESVGVLEAALDQLRANEREILPRRKRRALGELEFMLQHYEKRARRQKDTVRLRVLDELGRRISSTRSDDSVDLSRIANWWLDLIRPQWKHHIQRPGRRKSFARLKDLRSALKSEELTTPDLETGLDHVVSVPAIDRRIIAAVVGVADR